MDQQPPERRSLAIVPQGPNTVSISINYLDEELMAEWILKT